MSEKVRKNEKLKWMDVKKERDRCKSVNVNVRIKEEELLNQKE